MVHVIKCIMQRERERERERERATCTCTLEFVYLITLILYIFLNDLQIEWKVTRPKMNIYHITTPRKYYLIFNANSIINNMFCCDIA